MAAAPIIMAVASVASVGVAVVSAQKQEKAAAAANAQNRALQEEANRLQQQSATEQKKANAVQSSQNAQRAAQEQRAQIRDERVRRAQIMQSAENQGAGGSSGQSGATSGLATNLGANLGMNQSAISAGQQITGFNQASADYNLQAQQTIGQQAAPSNKWGNLAGLGMQMFGASGGFGAIKGGYNYLFSK